MDVIMSQYSAHGAPRADWAAEIGARDTDRRTFLSRKWLFRRLVVGPNPDLIMPNHPHVAGCE